MFFSAIATTFSTVITKCVWEALIRRSNLILSVFAMHRSLRMELNRILLVSFSGKEEEILCNSIEPRDTATLHTHTFALQLPVVVLLILFQPLRASPLHDEQIIKVLQSCGHHVASHPAFYCLQHRQNLKAVCYGGLGNIQYCVELQLSLVYAYYN